MNLMTARAMFIQDRMDWRKPHLNWFATNAYRMFSVSRLSIRPMAARINA